MSHCLKNRTIQQSKKITFHVDLSGNLYFKRFLLKAGRDKIFLSYSNEMFMLIQSKPNLSLDGLFDEIFNHLPEFKQKMVSDTYELRDGK